MRLNVRKLLLHQESRHQEKKNNSLIKSQRINLDQASILMLLGKSITKGSNLVYCLTKVHLSKQESNSGMPQVLSKAKLLQGSQIILSLMKTSQISS